MDYNITRTLTDSLDKKQSKPDAQVVVNPIDTPHCARELASRKVVHVSITGQDSAFGRVTTMHELLHAHIRSPRPKGNWSHVTRQAIEDVIVQLRLPNGLSRSMARDQLSVAIRDLRYAMRTVEDMKYVEVNMNAVIRAVATLRVTKHLGIYPISKKVRKLAGEAVKAYFVATRNVTDIMELLARRRKRPKRKEAYAIFERLIPQAPKPDRDTRDLPVDTSAGQSVPMDVVRHPLVVPSASAQPSVRLTRSGAHIVMHRVVSYMTGGSSAVFRRRIRQQGGTVLIDASGSMRLTNDDLLELLKHAPAAWVGYYLGEHRQSGADGALHVIAENGMRVDTIGRRYGMGNDVDLWALEYALRTGQPPFVLVSDCEFCGGRLCQAQRALRLVEELQTRRVLRVCEDMNAAIKLFQEMGQ